VRQFNPSTEVNMKNRGPSFFTLVLFVLLVLPLVADQKPPAFFFGGGALYVGMSKAEAAKVLLACCKISPPLNEESDKTPMPPGMMPGYMISPKEGPQYEVLGIVYFLGGRIVRITRPLASGVDDLVTFVRAMQSVLGTGENTYGRTAVVSVRHDRRSNGSSEVVQIIFQDGRGIDLTLTTLDKPDPDTNARDFPMLDATLDPAR
jgi:hypothetical protein